MAMRNMTYHNLMVMQFLLPIRNSLGLGNVLPLDDHIVRKAFGHFLECTVLGGLLSTQVILGSACGDGRGGIGDGREDSSEGGSKDGIGSRLAGAVLIGLIVAAIDETIQIFSPGRGASVSDVALDLCGVITGMAVVIAVRMVINCSTIKRDRNENR